MRHLFNTHLSKDNSLGIVILAMNLCLQTPL